MQINPNESYVERWAREQRELKDKAEKEEKAVKLEDEQNPRGKGQKAKKNKA